MKQLERLLFDFVIYFMVVYYYLQITSIDLIKRRKTDKNEYIYYINN